MKVVVNRCYGGFSLSVAGIEAYLARQGKQAYWFAHEGMGLKEKRRITDPENHFVPSCYTDKEGTEHFSDGALERNDPDLVAVVEELGVKGNGQFAKLVVIEVPDDVEWTIEEYDGQEWVAEKHRTWG